MAKIVLSVDIDNTRAEAKIKDLEKRFQGLPSSLSLKGVKVDENLIKGLETLKSTLSSIRIDPNLTNSVKALTEHYKQLGIVVRDIAKEYSNLDIQQRNQQKIANSQASNVETVRKGYANLISTLKGLKGQYAGGIFDDVEKQAQENFRYVRSVSSVYETVGTLTDEGIASVKKYSQELKKLQADLAQIKATNTKIVSPTPFTTTQAQQIPRLIKQYSTLLTSLKNTEKYYPKGTFDTFKNDLMTGQTRLNVLNTEFQTTGTLSESSQTQLNNLANGFNQLNASVAQTQSTLKSTKGGLSDIVSGFLKFQLSAMLVMKPLQLIRSALSSINETLVKTEDAVIALQRVLPSGSASDSEISSRLYKIAADYGQTFDNVSQIAENFARTGMSWADTIKATEAAVLALSVAELDAEEATNGLIAILSQFGLEASDLETVIDKLNKTADNFPVTTEKILAALQRTGSAADNANLSLDQTIALITALSKATGRSGENIGTALNSLIQYSSKSSALDTFAKLSEDSAKVVAQYRQGGATILDVWQQVSKEIQNLKSDQADLLDGYFNTDDGSALKEALDGELEDIYTELGGVYDTANTFRKNYFIALLGNMDTVEQAIGTLGNAAGYSQDENQKYLDTYTAKLNTLKAQWEDIANSEQGLLGLKKFFIDVGSTILTFTQSIGGLRTVLIALGSTIGSIFGGKIIGSAITNIGKLVTSFKTGEKSFKGLLSTFGKAINPIKKFQSATQALRVAQEAQRVATEKQNLADSIRNGNIVEGITLEQADTAAKNAQTVATNAAATATKAWGLAIQTALGWIGLLVTGVSMIVGIVQQVEADRQARIEQQRREREETIEQWEAIKDEAIAFAELNNQYNELKNNSNKTAEQEKEFLSVQESIVKTLGYKAVALKKLQEGTEEYQKKLEELTQAEMKRYAMQAQNAANAAKGAFADSFSSIFKGGNFSSIRAAHAISPETKIESPDSAFGIVDYLAALVESLYDNGYKDTDTYSQLYKLFEQQEKSATDFLTAIAESKTWEYGYQNGLPKTQDEINNIVNSVIEATGATENWRDTIEGVVVELTGFKPPKKEIENWSNDITKVTGKYDKLISKLEELRDLQKESTEWEEKKLAVMEAEQALENARNEATVRRFNQATGQWEWQTDEKEIAEAEKNLEQAQLDLQEAAYSNIIEQLKKGDATNESILAILQEVAPLLGADNDFVDAVINAFKDKTGVDITKPAISNFDAAQNYINEKGLKESDREKWTEDKTFEKLYNALTDEEKAKLKGKSYDSGGIANGLGVMVKATAQPETVNDPELTRKILSPVSNAEFNRYVRDMGIMFERSHQYAQTPIIERVGGAVDNRVNNSGQVIMNGVAIGSDKRGNSLDEILSLANIVPNV